MGISRQRRMEDLQQERGKRGQYFPFGTVSLSMRTFCRALHFLPFQLEVIVCIYIYSTAHDSVRFACIIIEPEFVFPSS